MKKTLFVLLAASTALVVSACTMHENRPAATLPPGKYEKTTSSTNAEGTTTKRNVTTEVTEDDEGHRKTVVKTKTTKDPKGLFNKRTVEDSERVVEERH